MTCEINLCSLFKKVAEEHITEILISTVLFPEMELTCSVQNYHWGKSAGESVVAALAASNDATKAIDDTKRYAEFWMGTHPSGPSSVKATGQTLADFLKDNPGSVGGEGASNLPYLFKVLSVDTALSIQVHPCKAKAEQLHKARPDLYKDDNHKPNEFHCHRFNIIFIR